MKELFVIVDVSGSMYSMGKTSVVGSVLQALSTLENMGEESGRLSLTKMQWDGSSKALESLAEKCSGRNTLLLTDGYALSDNCKASRVVKNFLQENKDRLFVVLCGGDALNVSAMKDFSRVRSIRADNVLYAVESLS